MTGGGVHIVDPEDRPDLSKRTYHELSGYAGPYVAISISPRHPSIHPHHPLTPPTSPPLPPPLPSPPPTHGHVPRRRHRTSPIGAFPPPLILLVRLLLFLCRAYGRRARLDPATCPVAGVPAIHPERGAGSFVYQTKWSLNTPEIFG